MHPKIAAHHLFKQTGMPLIRLARRDPAIGNPIRAILREAAKWDSLPKGWTQESVEKFWGSLTGEAKHKVTKCIERMGDHMDDPGAFCASLADKVDPGWRSRRASAIHLRNYDATQTPHKGIIIQANYTVPESWIAPFFVGPPTLQKYHGGASKEAYAVTIPKGNQAIEDLSWPVMQKLTDRVIDRNPGFDVEPEWDTVSYNNRGYYGQFFPDNGHLQIGFIVIEASGMDSTVRIASDQESTGLINYINGREPLVTLVIRSLKSYVMGDPQVRDAKAASTWFIYSLFGLYKNTSLSTALWNLFEHRGPSLDSSWTDGEEMARMIFTRLGRSPMGRLSAAAISLSLLARTRQPKLAAWLETLLTKFLHKDIDTVGPGFQTATRMNPDNVFESMITPQIHELATRAFKSVGAKPADVETFAFLVAEDANWHSLSSIGQQPDSDRTQLDMGLVSDITSELSWNIIDVATFIVAMLRMGGLPLKANMVKRECIREFPDAFQDLGPIERMASKTPISSSDWELYDMPGAAQAAKALTTALIEARRDLSASLRSPDLRRIDPTRDDNDEIKLAKLIGQLFSKHLRPVMQKFAKFGASDSEPRYVGSQALIDTVKTHYGFTHDSSLGDYI